MKGMENMDYREILEKAKEIDEKATPGPWVWDLRECNHQCLLTTDHSGKYYVMGFQRWGLQDALPSFQVYDRYEGPMRERGSHGMVRADKMSKSYPGKEHHHGFDNFIDHPDARYIAESRELFHLMITTIDDLISRAEKAEARADKVERERDEAIKQLHGICSSCKHYTPYHNDGPCATCTHEIACFVPEKATDKWEWCGLKEE